MGADRYCGPVGLLTDAGSPRGPHRLSIPCAPPARPSRSDAHLWTVWTLDTLLPASPEHPYFPSPPTPTGHWGAARRPSWSFSLVRVFGRECNTPHGTSK